MILNSYASFAGEGTVLLLDVGTQIHAVRIKPPDRLGTAWALCQAKDLQTFEVVSNGWMWPPDSARVACLECDGAKCAACFRLGWVPLDLEPVIQVIHIDGGKVLVTVFGADGIRVEPEASGPMIDITRKLAATERSRNLRLADLLTLWEAAGMGEVIR